MARPSQIDAISGAVGKITSDPITWAPFLPLAAAYAFLGAPWWICLGAAAAVGTGVGWWWKRQWRGLRGKARLDNLKSYLAHENLRLTRTVNRNLPFLRESSAGAEWADDPRLTLFLDHKRAIETRILHDGILTADEEEISQMISSLSEGICNELERLSVPSVRLNPRTAQATVDRIAHGIATLERTHAEIDTMLTPVPESDLGPDTNKVATSAERLHERIEQARAIRRRVMRDLESPETPGSNENTTSTSPSEPLQH